MMASEYKKRGGDYTTDKKDDSAKNLDNWTEEEWQTKEGSGSAKQEDGTEKRYLPKKAWEEMSEKEKEETDQKKQDESKEGKQHVENTSEAKNARKNASKDHDNQDAQSSNDSKPEDCAHHWEDHHARSGSKEYQKFKEQDRRDSAASENAESEPESTEDVDQEQPAPKKRGRGANQKGTNKKQKTSGSSKEPQGTAGDKTRVPKVGQQVQWHALPGYVDGEVVEIVYEDKTVEGKPVKASKEDPRVVLKSSSSGKIAVHKPEVVYWD